MLSPRRRPRGYTLHGNHTRGLPARNNLRRKRLSQSLRPVDARVMRDRDMHRAPRALARWRAPHRRVHVIWATWRG